MSDEVTRQMREQRQEDRSRVEDAIRKYMRSPSSRLTDAEMEALGFITGTGAPVKTTDEIIEEDLQRYRDCQKQSLERAEALVCEGTRAAVSISWEEAWVKVPSGLDPQAILDEFRACKQDPAFSAWATKWAVKLCRALGAE